MVNMVSRSMNGLFTDLCVTVVLSWISHKIAYSFPVPQPKCIESHAFWRNIFIFIEHTNFSRGMLNSILALKKYIVKLTKIRILLQKLFQIVMSYDIILSMCWACNIWSFSYGNHTLDRNPFWSIILLCIFTSFYKVPSDKMSWENALRHNICFFYVWPLTTRKLSLLCAVFPIKGWYSSIWSTKFY